MTVLPCQRVRNFLHYDDDDLSSLTSAVTGEEKWAWPVWAIVVCSLTVFGLLVCLILFLVLCFAYPSQGGTTVLGYMAVLGILCIYAVNFAFFFPASEVTCGIRRFMMGVVYMVTFAPLLLKAIDNWRLKHVDYDTERYR